MADSGETRLTRRAVLARTARYAAVLPAAGLLLGASGGRNEQEVTESVATGAGATGGESGEFWCVSRCEIRRVEQVLGTEGAVPA
jgi:hypothetical protein